MNLIYKPSTEKKKELERLLAKGAVTLLIDSRKEGVKLPQQFLNQIQVPINLDYNFNIPDFRITENEVQITLEFFHILNFFCVFPYPSIYAIKSTVAPEGVLFMEDLPKEILQNMPPPTEAQTNPVQPEPLEKKKPHLVAIPSEQSPPSPSEPDPKKSEPKKKGHLRLVE